MNISFVSPSAFNYTQNMTCLFSSPPVLILDIGRPAAGAAAGADEGAAAAGGATAAGGAAAESGTGAGATRAASGRGRDQRSGTEGGIEPRTKKRTRIKTRRTERGE